MGAPSSAILSEIYLQHMEHTKIIDILTQHNILRYHRYVDDILVIYDYHVTDINDVHKTLNILSSTIKFTLENETEHHINFLDLTIHNTDGKLSFSIYRKPTATDIIIPATSSHPPEHKHAAIRYMTNRLHTYRPNDNEKRTEQQTIEQTVTNNGYDTSIIKQLHKPKHTTNKDNTKLSWAKFTYFGKQTRVITKLFTQTPLRISLQATTPSEKFYPITHITWNHNNNSNKVAYTALLAQTVICNILVRQEIFPKTISRTFPRFQIQYTKIQLCHTSIGTRTLYGPDYRYYEHTTYN
jgi:hypothetical protein